MMLAIVILFLSIGTANADQMITLYPGQCVGVNGQTLCWYFRPSAWDHPDQPPRPCDFNRSCPITYLLPDGYPDFSTTYYPGFPVPIIDTYATPPIYPGYYYERKSLKDIGKEFKRVFGF